ncbi:MAG: hypothetical protein WBM13_14805 [Bacteroidia bacterium]
MTVQELIELLKRFPQDALVVTEGYETGCEPIKKVELITVEENKNREWWDGKYDKSENGLDVVFLDAESKKENRDKNLKIIQFIV